MGDTGSTGHSRFFLRDGPFTLGQVTEAAGGTCDAAPDRVLHGVAPLQTATPDQVSFLDNRRYAAALAECRAGAVIVRPDMADIVPPDCAAIVTTNPYLGWARVAALFHPVPALRPGVHPAAVVDPEAEIHPSAEIGPLAVIGPRARIGAGCRIAPGAVIGPGVIMGKDCRVGANASLECAVAGDRVYVYPGARIGQEGFGFAQSPAGFVTVPQLGRVILEDDVEVGANSTVDRGSAQDTVIGAGTRIDNLVQVGHNVRLGRCCVIVAMVGIAGSTVVEDFVQVGGHAAIAGHLRLGTRARIGAQSGVMRDVAPGADVVGSPAISSRAFFRQVATVRRLVERRDGPKGAEKG